MSPNSPLVVPSPPANGPTSSAGPSKASVLSPLAWSYSRHRLLETCERAIFWQYDGAYGGYAAPQGSAARQAWVLKHLTSLPRLLGTAIHQAARAMLVSLRDDCAPPTADEALESARAMLNQVWFTSARQQDRFWRTPGVYTALREVIYRGELSEGEIMHARDRLRTCLAHLYSAPVLTDVQRALASGSLDPLERNAPALHIGTGLPTSFVVGDGTTVWVDLDFGYQHIGRPPSRGIDVARDGTWCVTDLKTGAAAPEERLQLAVYGLYCRDVLRVPMPDGVYLGRIVDLAHARDRWFGITQDLIDGVSAIIAEDVERMRALREAADREPGRRASAYALASDQRACTHCNYLRLCRDELCRIRSRPGVGMRQLDVHTPPRGPDSAPVPIPSTSDGAGRTNSLSPFAPFAASTDRAPQVAPNTDPAPTGDASPERAAANDGPQGRTESGVNTECVCSTTENAVRESTRVQHRGQPGGQHRVQPDVAGVAARDASSRGGEQP